MLAQRSAIRRPSINEDLKILTQTVSTSKARLRLSVHLLSVHNFTSEAMQVLNTMPGDSEDDGYIIFNYKMAKKASRREGFTPLNADMVIERSKFVRQDGVWKFRDYQVSAPRCSRAALRMLRCLIFLLLALLFSC